jgi:hypothetical protein
VAETGESRHSSDRAGFDKTVSCEPFAFAADAVTYGYSIVFRCSIASRTPESDLLRFRNIAILLIIFQNATC